jgi:hypothetical protein
MAEQFRAVQCFNLIAREHPPLFRDSSHHRRPAGTLVAFPVILSETVDLSGKPPLARLIRLMLPCCIGAFPLSPSFTLGLDCAGQFAPFSFGEV